MNPLVSIIIPVYNVEKYLHQTLDSCVNQTLHEIEILCINDGSTDASGKICDEYAAKDSRFWVVHQENQGQSVARNVGLELACGEYIAFLDSDDWLEPVMCEQAYTAAKEKNSEILQFFFFMEGREEVIRSEFSMLPLDCYTQEEDRFACIRKSYGVVWNKLYKKDFLNEHGIRFLNGFNFEDNHFTAKAAAYAQRIDILHKKLLHYRLGVGYSSVSPQPWKYKEHWKMWGAAVNDFRKCDIPLKWVDWLLASRIYAGLQYWKTLSKVEKISFRQEVRNEMTSEDWQSLSRLPFSCMKNRVLFYRLGGKNFRAAFYWVYYKLVNPFYKLFRHLTRRKK